MKRIVASPNPRPAIEEKMLGNPMAADGAKGG